MSLKQSSMTSTTHKHRPLIPFHASINTGEAQRNNVLTYRQHLLYGDYYQLPASG